MADDSESPKMLPAPEAKSEEKKKNTLELSIDIKDLFTNIPEIVAPEDQCVWQYKEEMTEEYIKMNQTLQILGMYIARMCNEGPEVKDNINKRLLLLRTVLGMIMDHVAITGYDAYGLLFEMLQDTFMKVSGRKHVEGILQQIEREQIMNAQKRANDYTS
jgi:hypothetical protein